MRREQESRWVAQPKNKAGRSTEEEGVLTALRVAAGHGVRGAGVNIPFQGDDIGEAVQKKGHGLARAWTGLHKG
jgi:hypothetical protein